MRQSAWLSAAVALGVTLVAQFLGTNISMDAYALAMVVGIVAFGILHKFSTPTQKTEAL